MRRLCVLGRPAAVLILACFLSACGEKPQTATQKKPDRSAYSGPAGAYSAGTWKAGDSAAWEAQMRSRAQEQNEYSRSSTAP